MKNKDIQEENTIPKLVELVQVGKLPRRQLVKALTGMGISSAGIGAVVAAIIRPSEPPTKVNPTESTTTHLQLHEQHLTYQTQGNTIALQDDYADDAVVEDSLYSVPIVGRAAIIARKSLGMFATSDVQITVVNRIAIGNQVTVEWIATGIHSGDLPGLPASGRSFTLHGVTVVIRQDGKIIRESLYYDAADLRRQLNLIDKQ